jgi:hypothetical protein
VFSDQQNGSREVTDEQRATRAGLDQQTKNSGRDHTTAERSSGIKQGKS